MNYERGVVSFPESPISLDKFQALLPIICDSTTSLDADHWSKENPLWGHCAVVSCVAQSIFGGTLLRASLEHHPELLSRSHYVNRLPDGTIRDFTASQFGDTYPTDLEFEERSRTYVLSYPETQHRFALLSLRLAKEVTKNPLFEDPIYQQCFLTALSSPCQKMRFGAVLVNNGIVVAEGTNTIIPELESLCDPTCIRFTIPSRTESMIGACGHAEEWALKNARDKHVDLQDCDMYVVGVKMNGMPWFKEKNEATCLRCAVQLNYAGIRSIQSPVVNHWEGLTPSQALGTAKTYALGQKKA